MKIRYIYLVLFGFLCFTAFTDFEDFLRSHQKPTPAQIQRIERQIEIPESLKAVHEVCGRPERGKLGEWLECKKEVQ